MHPPCKTSSPGNKMKTRKLVQVGSSQWNWPAVSSYDGLTHAVLETSSSDEFLSSLPRLHIDPLSPMTMTYLQLDNLVKSFLGSLIHLRCCYVFSTTQLQLLMSMRGRIRVNFKLQVLLTFYLSVVMASLEGKIALSTKVEKHAIYLLTLTDNIPRKQNNIVQAKEY